MTHSFRRCLAAASMLCCVGLSATDAVAPSQFQLSPKRPFALFTRRYVEGTRLALNLNEQHPSTVDASDKGQQSPWNNPIDPTRLV
jgi:hypothetical protein